MKLAKEWLNESLESHPECQAVHATQLPTRVIGIGPDSEAPHFHISNGDQVEYLMLSHCRGKGSPLTTTDANIADRVAGITLAQMPRTFQDAVRVTHLLRFKYL